VDSGHRNIVDRHGTWSNFSGRVHAQPSRVSYPRSETELQTLVRDTRENVRAVGTGHSCTPLCATDGLLVCLDDIAGIVAISKDKQTATIRGGSKIHDLGPTLRDAARRDRAFPRSGAITCTRRHAFDGAASFGRARRPRLRGRRRRCRC
jgi:FAD/FMN-containing dehydrogenase